LNGKDFAQCIWTQDTCRVVLANGTGIEASSGVIGSSVIAAGWQASALPVVGSAQAPFHRPLPRMELFDHAANDVRVLRRAGCAAAGRARAQQSAAGNKRNSRRRSMRTA
jgi:hypothetical protein